MSDNTKLTDEQIKEIGDFLEENKSEQVKEMEEVISNVEVNPDAPLEESDIYVGINSIGKPVEVQVDEEDIDLEDYSNLFDDGKIPEVDFFSEEVKDELIVKAIKDLLNCTDADSNVLLSIIKEYKVLPERDRKTYQVYNKLPDSVKAQINRINGNSKAYRNEIALNFLDSIIKEAVIDKEVDNVKDLMNSVAKELDMSNTVEMYTKYQKGLMEDNLRSHAEKLRTEGDTEKAEKLDLISSAYHDSYTFESIKNGIINNGGKYKIKPIEIEKYETRVFDDFNRKYINSEFNIPNILEALKIACNKMTDYDEYVILKFFIIFCKYCKNFTPDNIEQHTFMYYTLMNIITLNFEDINEDNEFTKEVKKSLSEVLDLIKERY